MNERGISIVEALVYVAAAGMVASMMTGFFSHPMKMVTRLNMADSEQTINKAADMIARDFKEAVPTSIPWDLMPPLGSGTVNTVTLSKEVFEVLGSTAPTVTQVTYTVDAAGVLRRTANGDTTVVASRDLQVPSMTVPLVAKDSTPHIVEIRLVYAPQNRTPRFVIRRVTIRS